MRCTHTELGNRNAGLKNVAAIISILSKANVFIHSGPFILENLCRSVSINRRVFLIHSNFGSNLNKLPLIGGKLYMLA